MTTFRTLLRKALIALPAAGLLASSVSATPLTPPAALPAPDGVMVASGDCYAIGMQHAAQSGGQLARATPEMRGGQRVCVIVVLIPAQGGQRPRRAEIVVPAG